MNKREFCEVLGVSPDANETTLKKAYLQKAKEFHPDKNRGHEGEAQVKFEKIREAYDQLSSQATVMSKFKNIFKSEDMNSSLQHFLFTSSANSFNFSSVSCSDLRQFHTDENKSNSKIPSSGSFSNMRTTGSFSDSFGFNKIPRKGKNLQTTLSISFMESVNGCLKAIAIDKSSICDRCGGLGFEQISLSSENEQPHSPTIRCSVCSGKGQTQTIKSITIEVPAGVSHGSKHTLEGEGEDGIDGGVAGDLIILFEVESSAFYERRGDDVISEIGISFPRLVLGTFLEINSIYGKSLKIKLEPGLQHNELVKIPDEGFINSQKRKKGDMYLRLVVQIPKNLTNEERDILNQLNSKPNFSSDQPFFQFS